MRTETGFTCSDCKAVKPVPQNGGTGYATWPNRDHEKICYQCCAVRDRASMRETGRAVLYLAPVKGGGWTVGNWPGTLKFPVLSRTQGRHNIAGSRTDVWFKVDGARWHGVQYGENTEIVHCRRGK